MGGGGGVPRGDAVGAGWMDGGLADGRSAHPACLVGLVPRTVMPAEWRKTRIPPLRRIFHRFDVSAPGPAAVLGWL